MRSVHRAAWLLPLVFATSLAGACDPRVVSQTDGGMHMATPPKDKDAGPVAMSTGGGRAMPPFEFDGGPPPLPDDVCSLHVGATCDGAEDCQRGQVCCGEFDTTFFTYRSIGCKADCSEQDEFEFCHPGDTCRPGLVCRRSLIAPFDFVGVCATATTQSGPVNSEAVAGEVACGDTSCDAQSEQCCLRVLLSASAPPAVLTPYCAERGASCGCKDEPQQRPDAGPRDMDGESDAGGDFNRQR